MKLVSLLTMGLFLVLTLSGCGSHAPTEDDMTSPSYRDGVYKPGTIKILASEECKLTATDKSAGYEARWVVKYEVVDGRTTPYTVYRVLAYDGYRWHELFDGTGCPVLN